MGKTKCDSAVVLDEKWQETRSNIWQECRGFGLSLHLGAIYTISVMIDATRSSTSADIIMIIIIKPWIM